MPSPTLIPAAPKEAGGLVSWAAQLVDVLRGAIDEIRAGLAVQDSVVSSRLQPSNGAELAQGDTTPTGWGGAGYAIAFATGTTDARGRITVTAGAAPALNPTLAITFVDGAFPQAPFAIVAMNGGTGAQVVPTWALTTTALTITYPGTPVAGLTYVFEYIVLG